MRYLPTVDLWNPAILAAVEAGQMQLQRGQWVNCGSSKKARFVGVSKGGSLYVAHDQGSAAATRDKFKSLLSSSGIN